LARGNNMEQKERELLEKKLEESIKKIVLEKPFLASVCILEHESNNPKDNSHNEVFIFSSEPLDKMSFRRAKVLIEGFWIGIQTFLNKVAINPQNVMQTSKQKEFDQHYA